MKKIIFLALALMTLMSCKTTLYRTSELTYPNHKEAKQVTWINRKIDKIRNTYQNRDDVKFYDATSNNSFKRPRSKVGLFTVLTLDVNTMQKDAEAKTEAKDAMESQIENTVSKLIEQNKNSIINVISKSISVNTDSNTSHSSVNGQTQDIASASSTSNLSISNLPLDKIKSFWQILKLPSLYKMTVYSYFTLTDDELNAIKENATETKTSKW